MAAEIGGLSIAEIRLAVSELDALCLEEYGLSIGQLLLDPSPAAARRLERLTGILLKRPFAIRSGAPSFNVTGARASWPWADNDPDKHASWATAELGLLNELRMPGPWNERAPFDTALRPTPITWDQFKDDVENERGLFKVLALYLNDKVKRRHGKTFDEYLEADEGKEFEAGLDLTMLVFDAAIAAPVASVVGIPTVAVGATLVAIRYGYRVFTEPNVRRRGDSAN